MFTPGLSHNHREDAATIDLRDKMIKRQAPEGPKYVYRQGYNSFTASYSGGRSIHRLSGSSLNRKKNDKEEFKRLVVQKARQMQEEATGKIDPDQWSYWYWKAHDLLWNDEIDKSGYRQLDSRSVDRNVYRSCDEIARDRNKTRPGMSARTKSKVRDKFTALYRILGDEKVFMTLTFIAEVADKKAVRILNFFLTKMRMGFKLKPHYVWTAEKQKNSNIHFHMVLNRRIPIHLFNAEWVMCQYKYGLVYKDFSLQDMQARYEATLKNEEPTAQAGTIEEILNPLDVENIKHAYGLGYYLTKYVTKNSTEGLECLNWHCSRSVSRLFTRTVCTRSVYYSALSIKNYRWDKKTGEGIPPFQTAGSFWQTIYKQNREAYLPELSELEAANRYVLDGLDIGRLRMLDDEQIQKYLMLN